VSRRAARESNHTSKDPLRRHIEDTDGGGLAFHELYSDLHGRPHRTGQSLDQLPTTVVVTPVELWEEGPAHKVEGEELAEEPEDEDDDEPRPPFLEPRPSIMGPTTVTFPRNDGWYLPCQDARLPQDKLRKLSDLAIHAVTDHLTSLITKDQVPSCQLR
jgi:hypothetical protein